MGDNMGAMTPTQIGFFSKGWVGSKKKRKEKRRKFDPEQTKFQHLEEAKNQMKVDAARLVAIENFNECHDEKGRFCSGGGGSGGSGDKTERGSFKSGGPMG